MRWRHRPPVRPATRSPTGCCLRPALGCSTHEGRHPCSPSTAARPRRAPVFVAIFVGLGFWWGLAVGRRAPGEPAGAPAASGGGGISTRFWSCRVRGPLASRDHERQLGAARDDRAARGVGQPGLTTFWAMVTARSGPGTPKISCRSCWPLPWSPSRCSPHFGGRRRWACSRSPAGRPGLLLPSTSRRVGWASVAGGVIAFYQLGYGIAAFTSLGRPGLDALPTGSPRWRLVRVSFPQSPEPGSHRASIMRW